MAEKSLKQIIEDAANEFADELKQKVPVRTGRLKAGIKYQVVLDANGFKVLIIAEDYLKWLKERKKPLPSNILKWSGSIGSLPEMNSLPVTKIKDLSIRSQGILNSLNFENFLDKNDLKSYYNNEINKLIEKELK